MSPRYIINDIQYKVLIKYHNNKNNCTKIAVKKNALTIVRAFINTYPISYLKFITSFNIHKSALGTMCAIHVAHKIMIAKWWFLIKQVCGT